MRLGTLALATAALGGAACGHLDAAADPPALLVAPTAAVRAELGDALASAFNGRPVKLAPDALTASSLLIIEGPRTDRDLGGGVRRFRLLLRDSQCVLVAEAGDFERVLEGASCTPETTDD